MKPCSKNRKLVVLLALDELDVQRARELRGHLNTCEGCRQYLEEIFSVTKALSGAETVPDIQTSASFHQRVVEKLQVVESGSLLENLEAFLHRTMLDWRAALPATAALVIAVFALVALRPHLAPAPPPLPANQSASAASAESDLAPTIANYQMVASQSLEKLNELLTRQGNKRLPPAPIYTASTVERANTSF